MALATACTSKSRSGSSKGSAAPPRARGPRRLSITTAQRQPLPIVCLLAQNAWPMLNSNRPTSSPARRLSTTPTSSRSGPTGVR